MTRTYSNYITKAGDRLWYPTDQPVIGRHEIARYQFQRYLLKKLVREERGS